MARLRSRFQQHHAAANPERVLQTMAPEAHAAPEDISKVWAVLNPDSKTSIPFTQVQLRGGSTALQLQHPVLEITAIGLQLLVCVGSSCAG